MREMNILYNFCIQNKIRVHCINGASNKLFKKNILFE
jgi:hypothetical protein